jgi:Bacterial SH3 domain
MRELRIALLAGAALVGSLSAASAFDAMLGGNFTLYSAPHSRAHVMTLGAGEIVDVDHCDHGWCAVRHGPHSGYIYMPHVLDGRAYNPHARRHGGGGGGIFEAGADLLGAPATAAGEVVESGVSILR